MSKSETKAKTTGRFIEREGRLCRQLVENEGKSDQRVTLEPIDPEDMKRTGRIAFKRVGAFLKLHEQFTVDDAEIWIEVPTIE